MRQKPNKTVLYDHQTYPQAVYFNPFSKLFSRLRLFPNKSLIKFSKKKQIHG